MQGSSAIHYLELSVGGYRLAIRTDAVLGVLRDLCSGRALSFKGRSVELVDLQSQFGGGARQEVPFAVVLDGHGSDLSTWVAMGVDRVDNMPRGLAPLVIHLPRFGLLRPDFFDGALRAGHQLLWVLRPAALLQAAGAEFDAAHGRGV